MLPYIFFLSIISTCLSQYPDQEQYAQQPRRQYNNDEDSRPRFHPQILSHKQSLNHDGNFKYAFASDNGLLQGETIAPDGSRTGAYAYVDPSGRKISVKYVAGKEGFRILEGDHIPKAHPLIAAANQEAHPGYGGGAYAAPEARKPIYDSPPPGFNPYRAQVFKPLYGGYRPNVPIDQGASDRPRELNRPIPPERSNEVLPFPVVQQRYKNSLEDREPEYNDEPGKPNSFGSGYTFEFAG